MKMKQTDFDALHNVIRNSFSPGGRNFTEGRGFSECRKSYHAAGLTDERFRWDCLWSSGFDTRSLSSYLNDSHIDTALRRIVELIECGVTDG
jgi:hypothetical protein